MAIQQNLYQLMKDLRDKHPRLVVLFGENHISEESKTIANRVLDDANVGFFEAATDMFGEHNTLTRDRARQLVEGLRAKAMPEEQMQVYERLAIPETAVFVDETLAKRYKAELPGKAMDRLDRDNVPDGDPVKVAVNNIWLDRIDNRLMSSNKVMAKNMADYLDKTYPGDTPFFAVGVVGRSHLQPGSFREKNAEYDMKAALQKRGYTVVTVDMVPVPEFTHPYSKALGYLLADDQPADPTINYTVEVQDPKAYAQITGRKK
ncbi:MAG: hypothetical protein K2Q01_10010 [Rickettsiales bacterium]|nr:hypothetical protein [Rickettsiales bacterium]